jgi:hypothetical protein
MASNKIKNELLSALPASVFDALRPDLVHVELEARTQISAPEDEVQWVYFPSSALQSNEVILAQTQIAAACNALHNIEQRFCRWLLQTLDRSENDTITLTQEFLSEMLGVGRTSVTEIASKNAG